MTDTDELEDFLDILDGVRTDTKEAEAPEAEPLEPTEPLVSTEPAAEEDFLDDLQEALALEVSFKPSPPTVDNDDGDDLESFLSATGIKAEREVPDITKPWMKYHEFVLVRTTDEVERIVDEALENGRCSLDLETEGLDNRIEWDEQGRPRTVHQIVGFCIAVGEAKKGYYIPVRHNPMDGGPDLNVKPVHKVEAAITRLCRAAQPTPKPESTDPFAFREFETQPRVVIDFWHAKFDQEFLFPVTGIDFWHPDSFEDGQLAYFTLYSNDHNLSLKDKAKQVLRAPDGSPYEMIKLKELFPTSRKISFPSLSPDEPGVIKYAGSDAICTRLLCDREDLLPVINRDATGRKFTYRLEKQVAQVVRVMERNRVKVDRSKLEGLRNAHRKKWQECHDKIVALAASKGFANFEPGSPKQLGDFLFGERGLNISPKPPMNEKSQQYKTDYESLKAIKEELGVNTPEVLEWVEGYREEDKMLGTYLEGLAVNPDRNDELRFSFKQTGAATGRFTAPANKVADGFSGIPIHGIPGESDIRTSFVARPGYMMVKCDYAAEELRIVTNLTNEPVWVKEFQTGDGDLHSITARAFFNKKEVTKEERKMGKAANFALVYGGGPASIMRATGCNRLEAQRRKQSFDKAVPTFANWVKGQHEKVKRDLGVWTAFGRWIAIPDANLQKGQKDSQGKVVFTDDDVRSMRASGERHATNYPIQGSGADIMKISMVLLHKEFYRRGWLREQNDVVRMLLSVHDELVFEVKIEHVFEVIPVLTCEMEKPTVMARHPYSPRWSIPLVTEPLLGDSWGAEYGCHRAKEGEVAPEGGFIAHGYVYKKIPPALIPYAAPYMNGGTPVTVATVTQPEVASGSNVVSEAVSVEEPEEQLQEAPQAEASDKPPVAVVRLKTTTALSVAQVREAIGRWMVVDSGHYLKLVDGFGNILIDPNLKIRVNAARFAEQLLEKNLSDGKVGEEIFR